MDLQKQLGNNLKELRTKKKVSQEKLAELSDLDRTYIQSIEKGKRNISIEVLLKLSKALDIEVTDILKGLI